MQWNRRPNASVLMAAARKVSSSSHGEGTGHNSRISNSRTGHNSMLVTMLPDGLSSNNNSRGTTPKDHKCRSGVREVHLRRHRHHLLPVNKVTGSSLITVISSSRDTGSKLLLPHRRRRHHSAKATPSTGPVLSSNRDHHTNSNRPRVQGLDFLSIVRVSRDSSRGRADGKLPSSNSSSRVEEVLRPTQR